MTGELTKAKKRGKALTAAIGKVFSQGNIAKEMPKKQSCKR